MTETGTGTETGSGTDTGTGTGTVTGSTETAAAHWRLGDGDNTCGALAGVCGSVGLRFIAIDEMVMAFSNTACWLLLLGWLLLLI